MEGTLKDTTVTMSTANGSATVSGENFERAASRLSEQLVLSEIAGETPALSLFSVSGELSSHEHELRMFRRVRVMLLDEETGETISDESGYVTAAGAAEKKDADGDSITARVHKIKLG